MRNLMKERAEILLTSALASGQDIKAGTAAKWLSINLSSVNPVLHFMCEKGWLIKEGKARNTHYKVSPIFSERLKQDGNVTLTIQECSNPKKDEPATIILSDGRRLTKVGHARLLDNEAQQGIQMLEKLLADYQDLRALAALLEEDNKRLQEENKVLRNKITNIKKAL